MSSADSRARTPRPRLNSGGLFAELISRCRTHDTRLAEVAREAEEILARYEEDARDTADQLMIEARLEAARLLTDARREMAALAEQIAALHEAQREAASSLQQTRRALDSALGSVPPAAGSSGSSPAGAISPLPAARPPSAFDVRPQSGPVTPVATSSPFAARKPSAPRKAVGWHRRRRMFGVLIGCGVSAALLFATWMILSSTSADQTRASDADHVPAASTPDVARQNTAGRPRRSSASARPMTVSLQARRPSWVRATRDGTREAGYLLQPGQRRVLTASRHLSIRAGDAGALLISVNGGASTPFGKDGQPLTRDFGAAAVPTNLASGIRSAVDDQVRTTSSEKDVRTTGIAPVTVLASPSQQNTIVGTAVPSPEPALSPGGPASTRSDEEQILAIDRQWFDSFYRGDRIAMSRLSAPGFELADSRSDAERIARSVTPQRTLADVRVDVHGEGAVLSGRMIERFSKNGQTQDRESFVSEVWVKRDGRWQLLGIRLASGTEVRRAAESLHD
jgi:hypothetical protein